MKFIYRILAFVFSGVLMLIVMTVTYVAYLKVSKLEVPNSSTNTMSQLLSFINLILGHSISVV